MSDISQISLNGVTYDVKDETARTEANKKVTSSGGDIANTKVSVYTTSTESYPVPAANDTVKVGFGKIKKFFEDIRNATTGACFIGQIVNNCVTNNEKLPLSAAQGKALMDLCTQLNSDLNATKVNCCKNVLVQEIDFDGETATATVAVGFEHAIAIVESGFSVGVLSCTCVDKTNGHFYIVLSRPYTGKLKIAFYVF